MSGHQGIGKTPILLSLLSRGWQCLGDDKLFITQDRLKMVEPHVAISQYHFELLPWLSSFLPYRLSPLFPQPINTLLDQAAGMIWPGGLPVKVYCLLNPGMKIDLRKAPFRNTLVDMADPVHWIILQRGKQFSTAPLTREQGLAKLTLIQELFFNHRADLEKALCLYGNISVKPVNEILEKNLTDTTFSLVTFSGESDIDHVCNVVDANAG